MSRFFFCYFVAAFGLGSLPAAAQDVCQIDQSIAYAPRASCVFPACPSGANCPAPDLQLDRQSSSADLSDPLLTWAATCPDTTLSGGCWQATFEVPMRVGVIGQADSISVQIAVDNGQQVATKEYATKPDRITDTRVQGKVNVIYYVPPGQNFSLRVDGICAKTKAGRQLCVRPAKQSAFRTSSRASR